MKYHPIILMLCFALTVESASVHAQGLLGFEAADKIPAKPELEVRQVRLESYLAAHLSWVDHVCELSADQKQKLQTVVQQAVAKSQTEHRKPKPATNVRNYLYDSSPVRFVGALGAAGQIHQLGLDQELLKILSEPQQKKLQAANAERKQQLHDVFLERVFSLMDSKMPFSDKQKEQLSNLFPSRIPFLEDALYTMNPRTQYVSEKSILSLVMHPPMSFTKEQWASLQTLRAPRRVGGAFGVRNIRQSRFTLQAIDGPEGWLKNINKQAKVYQGELQKTLLLKADTTFAGLGLSPKDRRSLEVAAKGAAVRTVAEWKKKAALGLTPYKNLVDQQPGRNFLFSIVGVDSSKIEQHPFWTQAMSKVTTSRTGQRKGSPADSTLNYVVALLDQELWLDESQREKIKDLYRDAFIVEKRLYRGQQYELYLLATVVDSFQLNELKAVLYDGQLQAFKELKKQFDADGSDLVLFKYYDRSIDLGD